MKYSELQIKKLEEVNDLLKEKRFRLRELSFLAARGKMKNVKEVRVVKKDIARILTYIQTAS